MANINLCVVHASNVCSSRKEGVFSKAFFNETEGLGMWNQLVKKVVLANANYASSKRVLDLHGAYWGNISWC